jgi:hypothetical protein
MGVAVDEHPHFAAAGVWRLDAGFLLLPTPFTERSRARGGAWDLNRAGVRGEADVYGDGQDQSQPAISSQAPAEARGRGPRPAGRPKPVGKRGSPTTWRRIYDLGAARRRPLHTRTPSIAAPRPRSGCR